MALAIVGDEVTPRMAFSAGNSAAASLVTQVDRRDGRALVAAARNIVWSARPVRPLSVRHREILVRSDAGTHEDGTNSVRQKNSPQRRRPWARSTGTS